MFLSDRNTTEARHAGLATPGDFCRALTDNIEQLYLLAFLLTAKHSLAEQCLLAPVQENLEHLTVFKEWTGVWTKHVVIKKAALLVFMEPVLLEGRELWRTDPGHGRLAPIDDVTELPDFQRFAFVLLMLEGYSAVSCATLLNSNVGSVREAKTAALLRLSWIEPMSLDGLAKPARLQSHGLIGRHTEVDTLQTVLQLRRAAERRCFPEIGETRTEVIAS